MRYAGDWESDLQQGLGIEVWADGSRYEGHYIEGKKEGEGEYRWADGSHFIGSWKNNKIDGYVRTFLHRYLAIFRECTRF